MKTTKTLVSLLLVAVTVLTLPLTALASTVYSGSYNGNTYTATVGGSTSSISSVLSVSTAARLRADTTVRIKYVKLGESTDWGDAEMPAFSTSNVTSITNSYSYLDCMNHHSSIPSNGYFSKCFYYDYISGHKVLNGAVETFSL